MDTDVTKSEITHNLKKKVKHEFLRKSTSINQSSYFHETREIPDNKKPIKTNHRKHKRSHLKIKLAAQSAAQTIARARTSISNLSFLHPVETKKLAEKKKVSLTLMWPR